MAGLVWGLLLVGFEASLEFCSVACVGEERPNFVEAFAVGEVFSSTGERFDDVEHEFRSRVHAPTSSA